MMKKPFFNFATDAWQSGKKFHLPVWIALHAAVLILFLFTGELSVNTDLVSMLPETGRTKSVSEAEKIISSRFAGAFNILVGHEEFERARESASHLAATLSQQSVFRDIQCEMDSDSLGRLQEWFFKFRYRLVSPATREALLSARTNELSERAFMVMTGPVSMGNLDHLDLDPFLLSYDSMGTAMDAGLLSTTAMSLRDNVLTAEYGGKSWILVTGQCTESGLDVQTTNNAVEIIHKSVADEKNNDDRLEVIYSGTPFHSYDSARRSEQEISILGSISTIFIIFIMLFIFRSLKPLLATVGSMAIGIATGLAVTMIVFRDIHIFTIVFGTSIIGISIDYSLHYFSVLATGAPGRPVNDIIRQILPGITIGLFTTLVSYIGFIFTSFPLLQQMALFSMVGLLSSFASVLFVYPMLGSRHGKKEVFTQNAARILSGAFKGMQRIPVLFKAVILAILAVPVIYMAFNFQFGNDIRAVYRMSDLLLRNEQKAAAILNVGSTGIMAIVEGDTPEETRIREEELMQDLADARASNALGSAIGQTLFVPSRTRQEENYELVGTVLSQEVPMQLSFLGFGEREIRAWELDYTGQKDKLINEKDLDGLPAGSMAKNLWLGKIGGKYFSAVLLFHINDMEKIRGIMEKSSGRFLLDRVGEVNHTLQSLSIIALFILGISYLVIFVGLLPRYGLARSFQIVVIPTFASILSMSFLSIAGLPFNLFAVMGLILVPGMGTDYVIFFTEGKSHPGSTILAISLSMSTTVLGFGLLGFTSLAAVFGITVGVGVLFSFLLTPLLIGKAEESRVKT
ncbi:MAG: hypothetical protein EHM28_04350 [Spirochaetaceae bacterium]|nr:MAG: hypothetical protein EHM28_04350 [Spirochaetaceae bacterium]